MHSMITSCLGVRMAGGGSFDALAEQMQELNRRFENMGAEMRAIAVATVKTAKLLDGVIHGADTVNTHAA